jgi:hypothetical protein
MNLGEGWSFFCRTSMGIIPRRTTAATRCTESPRGALVGHGLPTSPKSGPNVSLIEQLRLMMGRSLGDGRDRRSALSGPLLVFFAREDPIKNNAPHDAAFPTDPFAR